VGARKGGLRVAAGSAELVYYNDTNSWFHLRACRPCWACRVWPPVGRSGQPDW